MARQNLDNWLILIIVFCLGIAAGIVAFPRHPVSPRATANIAMVSAPVLKSPLSPDPALVAENVRLRAELSITRAADRRIPAGVKTCGDDVSRWENIGVSREYEAACTLKPN